MQRLHHEQDQPDSILKSSNFAKSFFKYKIEKTTTLFDPICFCTVSKALTFYLRFVFFPLSIIDQTVNKIDPKQSEKNNNCWHFWINNSNNSNINLYQNHKKGSLLGYLR